MKRLTPVMLLPLLLVAGTASAALNRVDMDQLALKVWKVRAAFHTYTVMQGDATQMERLEEVIAEADDLIDGLNESAQAGDDQAFMKMVIESWERYRGFAMANTVVEMGYTDHYTILDIENEALRLSKLIDQQRVGDVNNVSALADLAVRLQHIASEYMFSAASMDGSGAIGTGADEKLEFAKAVPDFDDRMKQSQQTWASNPDISRELRSVVSKWAFIRESVVNFNKNSVPFLVQRYSEQMVESINRAVVLAQQ